MNKIIAIEPMGAPRMTRQDKWTDKAKGKGRPVVIRYFNYQDTILYSLPSYELPTVLSIEFHIGMPPSWSKKKKTAMAGTYHQSKPDIDNLVKGFCDSFRSDDAHVAVIHAGKYWCSEDELPCIVLELSQT